ncbi:MAG: alpha/beta hydrolase [Candidatus Latescibacterota bacterium]|nr:MAG: alpha/beta hydrolase [Candidatus Latescibacterota bacterium]
MTRIPSIAAKTLAAVLALCLLVAALYALAEHYQRRDYLGHFLEQKGQLVSVEETPIEQGPGHSLLQFRLVNDRGIRVEGFMSLPSTPGGPYPVLLILGGLRTGKRTLDYVGHSEDLVLVALDYPYEGKKRRLSAWEFVRGLPDMRRSVLNTVPAVMLSVDYLLDRKEIDPDRIVLIGGSLGALFSPAAGAVDQRIAAVGLIFGGGDLQAIAKANVKAPGPLRRLAAWFLAVLVSPVEPLKYIDRISPRPLLMLNGTDDPQIPEPCTRLLYEKAKDPKTIRWIPTGHVNVRKTEFGRLVGRELATWLADNDLTPPQALYPDSFRAPPAVRKQD